MDIVANWRKSSNSRNSTRIGGTSRCCVGIIKMYQKSSNLINLNKKILAHLTRVNWASKKQLQGAFDKMNITKSYIGVMDSIFAFLTSGK